MKRSVEQEAQREDNEEKANAGGKRSADQAVTEEYTAKMLRKLENEGEK